MQADFSKEAKTGPVVEKLEPIHKAVADFTYEALMRVTPVLTGFLNGGWTFSEIEGKIKTSTETILPLKDKKKGSRKRLNKVRLYPPKEKDLLAKYPRGVVITIANDRSYAIAQQEQKSFVNLALAETVSAASLKGVKIRIL